jgi:GYF domain 2/Domain of unknown function (DUF4234)
VRLAWPDLFEAGTSEDWMNYFVKRDTQEYGPYTLSELQRYTSTGNVLLTDLCRSEGMPDWAPVSQVIGNIPVVAPATVGPGSASQAYAPSPYPAPPNLHWGVVLLLGIVTCGIFSWVWVFVESAWMKKVAPVNKALLLYGLSVGSLVLAVILNTATQTGTPRGIGSLLNIAGWVLWLVASFNLRSGIEEHFQTADPVPSAMSLSGVMTFFFNVYYFQYHFTKVNELKKQQGYYVA